MNIIMKFIKSSLRKENNHHQSKYKKRISPDGLMQDQTKHTSGTPSNALGILEANISNSIASSTKCSGIQENSMGQVDGKGILKPPTSPTNQTTTSR